MHFCNVFLNLNYDLKIQEKISFTLVYCSHFQFKLFKKIILFITNQQDHLQEKISQTAIHRKLLTILRNK